jgi:DNA-binding transcriptional LysR family regulator
VSQAVQQLEEQLRVVLLIRTTRSVSLTDAGRKLVETAGPALRQTLAALTDVSAQPGEAVGKVRLSVPRSAVPFVITPVLPTFRARHPRVEIEVAVEERLVDIVAEGYEAGVRLTESIERDMVQVRLTEAFRFVVVGAPSYLARHGTPERPEDLLRHECITFRSTTTGALYAWELERGLLPQQRTALGAAAPLRRGGQGTGCAPHDVTATSRLRVPRSSLPISGASTQGESVPLRTPFWYLAKLGNRWRSYADTYFERRRPHPARSFLRACWRRWVPQLVARDSCSKIGQTAHRRSRGRSRNTPSLHPIDYRLSHTLTAFAP